MCEYNNTYGLKRNTQSVRIDPLAGSTLLGMRKTRSIKVSDHSSRQNAQFVVVEEIGAQQKSGTSASENKKPKLSSPLPIRALLDSVMWEKLDERAEQHKYEMSTWKMYDRITTYRMRKSTGGIPP